MIAYRTGEVFNKGHMIGQIKLKPGKPGFTWGFYPRFSSGRLSSQPTVESTHRTEVEEKIGCGYDVRRRRSEHQRSHS